MRELRVGEDGVDEVLLIVGLTVIDPDRIADAIGSAVGVPLILVKLVDRDPTPPDDVRDEISRCKVLGLNAVNF
jgi:hypothetical protein